MKISALILAKNEEETIGDCLKQLSFVDEIIVLDQKSKDKTVEIAKRFKAKILTADAENFAANRNHLASAAGGNWLLYIDSDERLSTEAKDKIREIIGSKETYSAYYFPRRNFILGKWQRHGGWWPDYVPRLFKKENLKGWKGKIHESPEVTGQVKYLDTPINHLTARSISQMFQKTIKWAQVEADLFYKNGAGNVTIFSVIKASILEFLTRYLFKMGFLDGTVGLIEAVYQAFHKTIILTYLWEKQKNLKYYE